MKRVLLRLSVLFALGCGGAGEHTAEASPVAVRTQRDAPPEPQEEADAPAPAVPEAAQRTTDSPLQAAPEAPDPAAPTPEPGSPAVITPLSLSLEQARAVLAGVSSLSGYASSFEPFAQSDIDAAIRRGKRSRAGITAWAFAPALSAWRPADGVAFQVLSGRVGADRALLAVVRASANGYEHVASTTLNERGASFAIGYRDSAPTELLFTSCYGCPGESGTLRYGADHEVTLEFR